MFGIPKRSLVLSSILALQPGCESTSPTEPADRVATIEAVQPGKMAAEAGSAVLPSPTVRVVDRDGQAVEGVPVAFTVTAGGGQLSSPVATTDAKGLATVLWTLGTRAGRNTASATVGALAPVVFEATGSAGPAARIVPVHGEAQVAVAGSALPYPLQARVVDRFENPVAGAAVSFLVIEGGGTISSAPVSSDSSGLVVSGVWTLGPEAGVQRVHAQTLAIGFLFSADSYRCASGSDCTAPGQLVFERGGQISSIRMDGTSERALTGGGTNFQPAWAPGGSRIAFAITIPGQANGGSGQSDIHSMSADGSDVVRHTSRGDLRSAAWSPDGAWLAVSSEGIYESDVYLVRWNETAAEAVHLASAARSPAWSPDGRRIAFVRVSGDDGYHHIVTIRADGTDARPLTEIDPGGITGLSWSPDGRRLAFSKCLNGACDVYILSADGSQVSQVTNSGKAEGAAWSPDGAWIAFTLSDGGTRKIAYVAVSGGPVRIVTVGSSPGWRP